MSYLKIKIDDNFSKPLAKKLKQAGPRVAHTLAVQIEKDTEPFVPWLTGKLSDSAQVVENKIIYPGPYARYLYEGKVMVYEGPPTKVVRPDGKVVLTRYGQRKKKIEKKLDIKKRPGHAQATDHWLKASRDQNIEKWIRVAGKAVEHELRK